MAKSFKSEQSGRSMIEALGYISVMMMITISVAASVNSGYYKFKLGRVNQEIVDLKKVVSQRWVASENYKNVNFQTLYDEKILPWSIKTGSETEGKHAFGGKVTIGKGDDEGCMYYIKFEGLPRDACVELAAKVWINNDGSDLEKIKVNNTQWTWKYTNCGDSVDSNHLLPLKITTMNECQDNWDNTIQWFFS